jgi:hypothetical protein
MNRDLLFVLMQTFPLLSEWQLQTLARQHGIRKDRYSMNAFIVVCGICELCAISSF